MSERSAPLPATFSSAMRTALNYTRWLVDFFRPFIGSCVLEVGVGGGQFRRHFGDVRYVGVDIDDGLLKAARAEDGAGLYLEGDITDPGLPARVRTAAPVDTVVCFNVLEHLTADRAAAEVMTAMLPSGGHLLLLVPAFPALYNDLDRLAGHERRYTRARVGELVAGLAQPVRLEYFNPIGGLGWWLNGLLSHDSLEDPEVKGQVKLFDRLVLPASRLLNPLTRRVFGQSVVCVARRS